MRVGKNIGQPAGIEENRGVTYIYIYIGSGHHVVVAGGQRCHRVATSMTLPPVTQGGGVCGLCVNSNHTSRM